MSLDKALDSINQKYGKGSALKVKDFSKGFNDVERQSSGSIELDFKLGGGYPRGRIIEVYGPESSGKTTLTIHAMAEEQSVGGTVAFIDAEHTFDSSYAEALGVNVDELVLSQPDNGEQAMEICKMLINSGEVNMIVVDSVAALTPKSEMEGEIGDTKMGLHARLMSQSMRMITGPAHANKCTVIFINQLRMKIGVMFGNPETTTGGNALKFYASVRLDIRAGQQLKDGDEVIGRKTKVKVAKNKSGKPFGIAHLTMGFGTGFDKLSEILDLSVEFKIIKKAGSWFSYEDTKLGQGRNGALATLSDNPDLVQEVTDKILEQLYVED